MFGAPLRLVKYWITWLSFSCSSMYWSKVIRNCGGKMIWSIVDRNVYFFPMIFYITTCVAKMRNRISKLYSPDYNIMYIFSFLNYILNVQTHCWEYWYWSTLLWIALWMNDQQIILHILCEKTFSDQFWKSCKCFLWVSLWPHVSFTSILNRNKLG